MADEAPSGSLRTAVTLTSPRRVEIEGEARWTVVPTWKRGAASGVVALVGVVLAVPAVALPPHGVVSALVLLVAGVAAYALWTRERFVDALTFPCSCGRAVQLDDVGQWTDDTWVRCPACESPWRVGPPR